MIVASTAESSDPFWPYVPEPCADTSRTLLFGSPQNFAIASRVPYGVCVDVQTVQWSPFQTETAADGPIDPCAMKRVVYVPLTLFGAAAIAVSALPVFDHTFGFGFLYDAPIRRSSGFAAASYSGSVRITLCRFPSGGRSAQSVHVASTRREAMIASQSVLATTPSQSAF